MATTRQQRERASEHIPTHRRLALLCAESQVTIVTTRVNLFGVVPFYRFMEPNSVCLRIRTINKTHRGVRPGLGGGQES